MCGIAGFYGFRNDNLIKKFSLELKHRGPDGEGFYMDNSVTLLSRRLAIIDVKTGQQPIYNEDKSIVVVYNGEIYNYLELREELEKCKHKFSTKSDTEVIVHGYEEWGENCFDRFNGMFAIALYDINAKKLLLVRDHFGIKPLYYMFNKSEIRNTKLETNSNNQNSKFKTFNKFENSNLDTVSDFDIRASNFKLLFSSEIKPLINSGLIKKKPNDKIIYRYLHDRVHDDTKETFFEGVYKLMPGELIKVQNSPARNAPKSVAGGKFKVQKYSNLENELINLFTLSEVEGQTRKLDNSKIFKFKQELIKAIQYRLISEVPVGTCLSGGLDSSTVVAVVNDLLKKHVKESRSIGKIQNAFSAVFPGSTNNENIYIESLVKSLKSKVESHKIYPKPEEFFKDLQDFIKTQEEPTISTGPYAQYKVMQEAHKYVTVLLDGQGSDEMMAGYIPYYSVYLKQLLKEKKYTQLIIELINSLDILIVQSIELLKRYIGKKKSIITDSLLNNEWTEKHKNEKLNIVKDNLKKRLVEDIFHNSLQSLLRYEDKNSMRFSIEGRVPFLDINLLKYIFSLGDEAIIKNGWNKFILREATNNLLPELINKRRNKIGFTTPEHEWFMKMKNKIYSIFMSESFIKRKYFNQPEVIKAFQAFIEGKFDDTMVFWRMMNVELWLREFIDSVYKVYKVHQVHKGRYEPNEGKKLEIKVDGKKYLRYPVKTELFQKGDDYAKKISLNMYQYIDRLIQLKSKDIFNKKWFLVVSEKIVAISQGRSYFIWDIKPSVWAKMLSKYVTKTPFGIGLGSPWTMELAIREIGVIRVIFAALATIITKPFGLRGIFYKIAGETVRSIDGPTEYSLYPSNVSAKLGPKEPKIASQKIHDAIKSEILNSKSEIISKVQNSKDQNRFENFNLNKSSLFRASNFDIRNFLGVVIIDANDIGRNVLGNTTGMDNNLIEQIMRDNPMGQADEQTPIVIVSERLE